MIHWFLYSPAGLAIRIAIGLCIFAALAIIDLHRHGRSATRWREYTVLLIAVFAAVVYGVLNDQITSRISWEYFYYGKELDKVLGSVVPPDPHALHLQAAKVGVEATWSAGLIFGVVLLLANNPLGNWPRLRNRELVKLLPLIILITAAAGVLLGELGYHGYLTFLQSDFVDMTRGDIFHPRRFICAWGVHLGGYLGGLLGTALAATLILHRRRRLKYRAGFSPPPTV